MRNKYPTIQNRLTLKVGTNKKYRKRLVLWTYRIEEDDKQNACDTAN